MFHNTLFEAAVQQFWTDVLPEYYTEEIREWGKKQGMTVVKSKKEQMKEVKAVWKRWVEGDTSGNSLRKGIKEKIIE